MGFSSRGSSAPRAPDRHPHRRGHDDPPPGAGPVTARRRRAGAGLALAALAVGGCSQRQLVTAPESPPSAATWAAVWVAAALAAVVIGVLLTLPLWRAGRGARLAVAVLAAHAGAVVVGSAVLIGAAIRSWQLIDRPVDADPEPALLRLSRVDGDTAFFALIVLVVVVVGTLTTLLLVLAAHFAASDDVVERGIACTVLALEILAAGYAMARLTQGADEWPYVAAATQVPVTIAAFIACWPRDRGPTA